MQVENRPHKISNRQTKARIVPTFKLNFIKEPKLETSQLLIENSISSPVINHKIKIIIGIWQKRKNNII